jgi:hypothetical protein
MITSKNFVLFVSFVVKMNQSKRRGGRAPEELAKNSLARGRVREGEPPRACGG